MSAGAAGAERPAVREVLQEGKPLASTIAVGDDVGVVAQVVQVAAQHMARDGEGELVGGGAVAAHR
jgi:hypothetical protein